ncbi:MAG: ScyD/ScyE family protein [Planctomycetes bacterium]|nr:ScyD/ScyE family protein [Planctomycetota bacterium]
MTLIEPSSGDSNGGTLVTLSGEGFMDGVDVGTVVTFGSIAATDVEIVDDSTITCVTPSGMAGDQVVVVVINSNGSGAACCYEYIESTEDDPVITGLDPDSGGPEGGTSVMISGANFTEEVVGETSVSFGGLEALDVVVVDDSLISCISPPGIDGDIVEVMVSNPRGVAVFDGFAYIDTSDDPIITSVEPNVDLPAGGALVTITGALFTEETPGETSVLFGDIPAEGVAVVDDETIECVAPAGLDNTMVSIAVSNPRGTAVLTDAFSYLDPSDDPVIDALDPSEGPAEGGELVTITGSLFTETVAGETSVTFGGVAAADVVVVDDVTITCTAPAGEAGDVAVVSVSNTRGTGSYSGYTYTGGAPVLASLSPSAGAEGGGELVTLTGERFSMTNAGMTSVLFGGVPATDVVIIDDMTITCVAPPGQGVVTVSVSNALGSSALGEGYTYLASTEATAADVDGDGLMDLVVGSPMHQGGGERAGAVHLYLSSGALTSEEDISSSAADLVIIGAAPGDHFGANVATGDLNQDGQEDLIVAAPRAAGDGMVYVFNGPLSAGVVMADVADHIISAAGTSATDSRMADRLGAALVVQDLNGDGADDLIIGAPGVDYGPSGTSVYAAGLKSPMGLHVAADGSLWVAESGSGSADPNDPEGSALDDSGVSRIPAEGVIEQVITGLPSLTDEGFAGGASDLFFDSMGSLVLVQQDGASALSNSVLEFDTSLWSPGAPALGPSDIMAQWEIASFGESLGYDHNNAYGVAEGTDGHLYVANAGSNSIFKIERPSGVISELVSFPQIEQPSPFGPPFTDSVPTRILAHADGFYVVNLTGFPFNEGAASVFNVDYAGNVTELASGLSRATDVALNPVDGSLYVAQFDVFDLTAGPPWLFGTGSVVRVSSEGLETVATLTTPTGVAFDASGNMYVSSMITGLVYRYAAEEPAVRADVGAAYVFHGGVGLAASQSAASADVILAGEVTGDRFGCSAGVGDYDGDGQADLFVGASRANPVTPNGLIDDGAVFLWLGPVSDSQTYQAADAHYALLGDDEGAMGASLAVGDVNGDGLDDLVVSAPDADSEVAYAAGLVLIFYGDAVVYSESADNADVLLHGATASGDFGAGLLVADLSGDGFMDILATAPDESAGAERNGQAYLFSGGPVLGDTWALAADVVLTGRARDYEHFGESVGAVDRDGDGVLDLCVSAYGSALELSSSGSVHLFSGDGWLAVDSDADEAALSIAGESGDGRFGGSLSSGE